MDHNKLWKILKEMGIPDLLTASPFLVGPKLGEAFLLNLDGSSSLSVLRVMSSAYLLLAILIPASFSLAFLIMYSAYKLNKQGDNMYP